MKYFLRLLSYARPYLFRLSLVFLLILLLGQAGLFMPLMQKFIIDKILLRSTDPLASVDLIYQNNLDTSQRLSDELLRHLETEGICCRETPQYQLKRRDAGGSSLIKSREKSTPLGEVFLRRSLNSAMFRKSGTVS